MLATVERDDGGDEMKYYVDENNSGGYTVCLGVLSDTQPHNVVIEAENASDAIEQFENHFNIDGNIKTVLRAIVVVAAVVDFPFIRRLKTKKIGGLGTSFMMMNLISKMMWYR